MSFTKQHESKVNLQKVTTRSQSKVLYFAALVPLLQCLMEWQALRMVVVNMALKRVVELLASACMDQMEKLPVTDVNVVLIMVLLADEEMSRKMMVSEQRSEVDLK